jgi:hypothetical protein
VVIIAPDKYCIYQTPVFECVFSSPATDGEMGYRMCFGRIPLSLSFLKICSALQKSAG